MLNRLRIFHFSRVASLGARFTGYAARCWDYYETIWNKPPDSGRRPTLISVADHHHDLSVSSFKIMTSLYSISSRKNRENSKNAKPR